MQRETDELYMRRCLQLARCGQAGAKPNPMVGAVIVAPGGRIIGEGYHKRCGEGHAEVNAFASVRAEDETLLRESTIYVSLEPCSHYGKTPPCADLIVSKGVRRVVCGCVDPFAKVQGRGIERMRAAGIEVVVGVMERACREINKRFFTYNTLQRPYITLKWAQTADGLLGVEGRRTPISSPFTLMQVHQLRSESDAILVGHTTWAVDAPSLTVREWAGSDPERIVLGHGLEGTLPEGYLPFDSIDAVLRHLYEEKKQSLLVEGGARTLQSFLDAGLWDELRVETAPFCLGEGVRAPQLPGGVRLVRQEEYDGRTIQFYERNGQ